MNFGQPAVNDLGQLRVEVLDDDGDVVAHFIMALVPVMTPRGIGLAIVRPTDDDHGWAPSPPPETGLDLSSR